MTHGAYAVVNLIFWAKNAEKLSMSRVMSPLLGFFMFLVGAVGYLYYGPPHHTHFVTRTDFYRRTLAPLLDKFLAEKGVEGFSVGYLSQGQGDLSFRDSSALVYRPARIGQRFFGGTVVSTGPESKGLITLFDDSVLELEPNTTVILDVPELGELGAVIDLQVVSGAVNAQKKSTKNIQLKVTNKRPESKPKINNEELVVPVSTGLGSLNETAQKSENLEQLQDSGVQAPESIQLDFAALDSGAEFQFEVPELTIEGPADNQQITRELASVPEPEPEWPLEIAPRFVPRRKKRTVVKVREFEAPPEINALTNALFAQKNGKTSQAHRYLAQSLTRKDYFGTTFNEASRFAINGLIENYLANKECDLAIAVIENTKTAFEKSATAQEWVQSWKIKSIKSCGQL